MSRTPSEIAGIIGIMLFATVAAVNLEYCGTDSTSSWYLRVIFWANLVVIDCVCHWSSANLAYNIITSSAIAASNGIGVRIVIIILCQLWHCDRLHAKSLILAFDCYWRSSCCYCFSI